MKKLFKIGFGACMSAGIVSLFGLAGYVDLNGITLATIGYGIIGSALILLGYGGLKITGCQYIE